MQPTSIRRPRRAALAMVGTGLLVAGVLSGGEAAFAATDSTFSALSSDLLAGNDVATVGADITNTSGTLTVGPASGTTGRTELQLGGHTLTVKAIELSSNQSNVMTPSTLWITGPGTLVVNQTSTSAPAIEVSAGSSLSIYSGTVTASVPAASNMAAIGGGPAQGSPYVAGNVLIGGSANVTATGGTNGAAIGGGYGGTGTVTVKDNAQVTASTGGGAAAIGDGYGAAGGSVAIVNNAHVVAHQTGTGQTGAGIGGGASPAGQTAGTVSVGDTATVTADSTGSGAAIGGGYRGDGGSVGITGFATVNASGAQAGIGDGQQATGTGTNVSISGSGTVVQAAGGSAAGIGGGVNAYGNDSLTVDTASTLIATSTSGPGIGGVGNTVGMSVTVGNATVSATGGSGAAGIGAGNSISFGAGSLSIGSGGTVTAAGGLTAIGGSTAGRFGSVSNSGTLRVPAGTTLAIPAGASVANAGTIVNDGTISGSGTVANSGSILQNGTVSAPVTGNNFRLTYDAQGGSVGLATQQVYAATVGAAGLAVPSATPPSAGAFTGWNVAADGTGNAVRTTTDLVGAGFSASSDGNPVVARVYALYQLNPVLPTGTTLAQAVVGSAYSSSVAATSGTAPISYSRTGDLPAGLSLDASSGAITGTPTTAGTFTMHLTASNAAGSSTHDYTIQVVPTLLTVGVSPTAKGNARYLAGSSATVTLGGLQANEAYTLTIGGSKVYSGTAPTSGAFTVKVTVPRAISDGTQSVVLSGGGHVATGSATILTAAVSKHLSVTASAKTVKAKKKFALTVSKLYAKEAVRVVLKAKGQRTMTATGSASTKGAWTLTVKKGLAKAKWTVTVTGAGTSRTAKLILTVR